MKKILFTDLDGTLLCNDKTVSEGNLNAIRKMVAAGHFVIPATGRTVSSAMALLEKTGLDGLCRYLIACQGAVVYDMKKERVMENRTVPFSIVEYLFAEAERYGIHIQTYTRKEVVAKKNGRELQYYLSRTPAIPIVTEDIFSVLTEEPNKVLLVEIDDHKRLVKFRADHGEWGGERLNAVFSCPQYLEYCPPGADKGTGIAFMRDYLNVEPENTCAVGDERNDIAMILAAGTGIAMKNGVGEAKAVADYVTERDNEHDAIEEIIETFIGT